MRENDKYIFILIKVYHLRYGGLGLGNIAPFCRGKTGVKGLRATFLWVNL